MIQLPRLTPLRAEDPHARAVGARSIRALVAAAIPLCLTLACAATPVIWSSNDDVTREDAARAMGPIDEDPVSRPPRPEDFPVIPVRRSLRPCCAFGMGIKARVGSVPVPGVSIGNIIDLEDLGPHIYDSGMLMREAPGEEPRPQINPENNGLIYTCRGGFIDTAHVRDQSDWTVYLASEFARHIVSGQVIDLPDEGGTRRIVLSPPEGIRYTEIDIAAVSATLAQWAAFQLSIWHEIATWYGWTQVAGFPQTSSAFSPDDLYSNVVGMRVGNAIAHRYRQGSSLTYNGNAQAWIEQLIRHLRPVDKELAGEVMESLDQVWWNSKARIPDRDLVLRRSLETESPIAPWLPPDSVLSPKLRAGLDEACGSVREPLELQYPRFVLGHPISEWLTLQIRADEKLATQPPFDWMGRELDQVDFPVILSAVRRQIHETFGEWGDRPN